MKRMKPGDSILLLKQTKLTNLISEHCQLSGQDDYRKFILVENCKIFFRSKKTGINLKIQAYSYRQFEAYVRC